MPAAYQFGEAARAGGLASHGTDQIEVIRRSASYIDRIQRRAAERTAGASPTKFELVINVKEDARADGARGLALRADEVIE